MRLIASNFGMPVTFLVFVDKPSAYISIHNNNVKELH